jgi:hypothetical protein
VSFPTLDPTTLDTLVAHIRVEDLVGLSDGDDVSSWTERVEGNAMTQVGSEDLPKYYTDGPGGYGVVRVASTKAQLALASGSEIDIATDWAIFVVYEAPNVALSPQLIGRRGDEGPSGTSNWGVQGRHRTGATNEFWVAYNGDSPNEEAISLDEAATRRFHVGCWQRGRLVSPASLQHFAYIGDEDGIRNITLGTPAEKGSGISMRFGAIFTMDADSTAAIGTGMIEAVALSEVPGVYETYQIIQFFLDKYSIKTGDGSDTPGSSDVQSPGDSVVITDDSEHNAIAGPCVLLGMHSDGAANGTLSVYDSVNVSGTPITLRVRSTVPGELTFGKTGIFFSSGLSAQQSSSSLTSTIRYRQV